MKYYVYIQTVLMSNWLVTWRTFLIVSCWKQFYMKFVLVSTSYDLFHCNKFELYLNFTYEISYLFDCWKKRKKEDIELKCSFISSNKRNIFLPQMIILQLTNKNLCTKQRAGKQWIGRKTATVDLKHVALAGRPPSVIHGVPAPLPTCRVM